MSTAAIPGPMPATEAIVWALAEAGVEYVLGMPGGYTGNIFAALFEHPTIRVVQVREESIGSTMAEAYGRLTGRPVVVMGQGEWIAGNAGQGFLEALLGSSPVIILTEMSDGGALSHHGAYQAGTGDYGAWDARKALEGVTKRVFVSHFPAQAVQHTQLAIKHAMTGTPGPVAVVFHGEALKGQVGPDSSPRLFSTQGYLPSMAKLFDAEAVEAAALALVEAKRPVIIAGNGVRVGQACAQLSVFAESLDIPVATTAGGKGVLPEQHALSLGVMGTFGVPQANAAVGDADVIVAVGTRLAPIDTGDENPALIDPARQTIIQIDVEPLNAGWTFPADHALIGQAGFLLERLQAAASNGSGSRGDRLSGRDRVREAVDRHGETMGEEFRSDAMPLAPQRIIRTLQEAFPGNGIITSDAGENRLFMLHWFKGVLPGGYLMPAAGGGMGYAVPAALGARLAFPDNPIVAVCGDGGFAMSIHALMTSVQEKLPITVIVFNNNALGWVTHGMGEKAVANRFDEFDHAAIARSVGARGVRIESADHLRATFGEITESRETFVIDVPASLTTSFKDIVQPLASSRWKRNY